MDIWFTADTHFNHKSMLISPYGSVWGWRKFTNVQEMNEHMIICWNSVVKQGDIIYHLGDFGWHHCEDIVKRLQGQKFLIEGSHDGEGRRLHRFFSQVIPMKQVRVAGQWITLTHCAMRVWEKSHYGSWNLYGHSHGRLSILPNSMDVGVDTNNYYPYSFEQVRDYIENFKKELDNPCPNVV